MTKSVVATAFGGPEVLEVVDEELPAPGPGEVLVEFKAIGVNPVEYKQAAGAFGADPSALPLRLGSEGAGIVVAAGPDAVGPDGPLAVGDEVVVYRGSGTYAERALEPAGSVLRKPAGLGWEQAGGLLLTGATAYDTVETVGVTKDDVVLIHGASGGVGLLAVQLARLRGATVIGTARETNHEFLRSIGAIPVAYGDGLADRVRELAPGGVTAAIDTVGTDEAVDVSLQLVGDRARIATIAAFERAGTDGFTALGGGNPDSAALRDRVRGELLDLAARGELTNPIAKTFGLSEAARAHTELKQPHPVGKFILIP
ncbi:NADP-dependent oxidoreductase [Tsukamurella sp. 8F]|uniref:NADP-dependent oxidoreductase n=1 Tax=unclassified Tsukamurella TaxID=2633480 RepID=UPI0023B9F648|nr:MULTISPECIES: NADP-dependent oxidoreductase [unclassified Tsukamurella]MDF0529220.1 NADP-dependent oxidoreductase [Tsukamurella sp. 8J]MDF0585405.1 NADP-dependent oxidoreductase [Tsukamurella sp. 8F]